MLLTRACCMLLHATHAAVLAWGLGVVAEAGLHDKSEGEQERGDEEAL